MKYKAGDEVLIKTKIDKVDSESSLPYLIKLGSMGRIWTEEKELLDCKTYSDGLNDAWQLAKKIYDMTCTQIEKIFDVDGGFWNVVREITVEEALAKIEAYEKEKEIKVGNEVIDNDGVKACVIEQTTTDHFFVFTETGSVEDWSKNTFKKTGKHIDIESLLRQIGE